MKMDSVETTLSSGKMKIAVDRQASETFEYRALAVFMPVKTDTGFILIPHSPIVKFPLCETAPRGALQSVKMT